MKEQKLIKKKSQPDSIEHFNPAMFGRACSIVALAVTVGFLSVLGLIHLFQWLFTT